MQSPPPLRSNRLRLRVPPRLSQPEIQSPLSRRRLHPSADKLHKAVRTADDGIKIHCPDVETFRSLNKYLVDFKVNFTRLPVHSVHRLCHRDGSPLWLVLAVLPRTEEAKNIFNNLNMVCGLSGIRVEAPHKKGGPGQCHRCQLYGHAAANCHADPRCVKCLIPHWTRECPRTRESGEKPSCVNCLQQHTANYRGCPKAPKFISYNRPKSRPVAPPRDLNNFPDLAETNQPRLPPLAPSPTRGVNQSPRCHRGPLRDRLEKLSASHPCRSPLQRPRAPHRLETTSKR
ncbi:Nucleic-acid-binding protein from transposon X-element [Eumeta japonica]|uniref:Nucleic-acid-binding protein from transposon X-element n=1 Tax=Eumeta variegata TaxID=151549 RepID=A0A4C1Z2Q4_EUMVA|nr:Nucleic-acid-binding protein from transposon X-element [Eumeta japonica]